jgi:hypothetical protein
MSGAMMGWRGKLFIGIAIALTGLLGTSAQASLVTSLPSGTLIPITFPINSVASGQISVTSNITWLASDPASDPVYGWTQNYNFGANGIWIGLPPMVGLNTWSSVSGRVDFFEYDFNDPVQGVGGIINWGTNDITVGPWGASISVYDASNNLLEEATLSNSGTNLLPPDSFYGFLENSPSISRFVLTDGFIGL